MHDKYKRSQKSEPLLIEKNQENDQRFHTSGRMKVEIAKAPDILLFNFYDNIGLYNDIVSCGRR